MRVIATILVTSGALCPEANQEPLRVATVLVGQSYCYGDVDLYRVDLKLRLRFENRTDQKLILDKEIGNFYYRVGVARTKAELAIGNFESHPIIDWFFSDKVPGPKKPIYSRPIQVLSS